MGKHTADWHKKTFDSSLLGLDSELTPALSDCDAAWIESVLPSLYEIGFRLEELQLYDLYNHISAIATRMDELTIRRLKN